MDARNAAVLDEREDFAGRVKFHVPLQVMEADFSHLTFSKPEQVDRFYDEVDRQIGTTGERWYFLVNYEDCLIEPSAWHQFAARGKTANITYSLGTARFAATSKTRQTIRERAKSEQFRSNLFETREEALIALAEMRRRHRGLDKGSRAAPGRATDIILSVENVCLSFGGDRKSTRLNSSHRL